MKMFCLGPVIKPARIAMELTQEDVAGKCEIDVRHYRRLETEASNPKASVLLALVDTLELDLDMLRRVECVEIQREAVETRT